MSEIKDNALEIARGERDTAIKKAINLLVQRDEAVEAMAAMSLRIIELQAQLEVSATEATRQAVTATTAAKPLDYRRLWLDLKSELEAQADKCVGDQIYGYRPTLDAIEAKAKLDHMLHMETLQR